MQDERDGSRPWGAVMGSLAVVLGLVAGGVVAYVLLSRDEGRDSADVPRREQTREKAGTRRTSGAKRHQRAPAVLGQPVGLSCLDLRARGYGYPDAVRYWQHWESVVHGLLG